MLIMSTVQENMVDPVKAFLVEVETMHPIVRGMEYKVEMSDLESFDSDEVSFRVRYGNPWTLQASAWFCRLTGERKDEPIRIIER